MRPFLIVWQDAQVGQAGMSENTSKNSTFLSLHFGHYPISIISRKVVPRQSPIFKKSQTRTTRNKHPWNIQRSDRVLQQLRNGTTEVQLTMAIAILRKMNPYTFEELLLTCCEEQGWQIQRNFRYSTDGGVDGHVLIAEKLYLLQAKRYSAHIKSEHIKDFHKVIQQEGAAGGFFIHTGKTGQLSKELLSERQINLISSQQLVCVRSAGKNCRYNSSYFLSSMQQLTAQKTTNVPI